jgi:hypothetical protein
MTGRPPRLHALHLAVVCVLLLLAGAAALWHTANDTDPRAARTAPDRTGVVEPGGGWGHPVPDAAGVPSTEPSAVPSTSAGGVPDATAPPTASPPGAAPDGSCRTGAKLVPSCGVLFGVAPGAFTDARGERALLAFEQKTGRHQDIYHAYHRGIGQLFPTKEEIAIARGGGRPRILFLNWKPTGASWAKIAHGDPGTDRFLDRLGAHIRQDFGEKFFFTVHHEAEDNVREKAGSGYTAEDFAAMFRHVVLRLRAAGATNLVTVVVHMAYVPHTSQTWFDDMYPGNDVVDWIGWDTYAYSDPGYGHGDFAELMNRRAANKPQWPGFYNWAVRQHPDKPLMVAEWGVWASKRNPGHKAEFYREVGRQITAFPRIKALVGFDTPSNQKGMDSRVDSSPDALEAYRELGRLPIFQVEHG